MTSAYVVDTFAFVLLSELLSWPCHWLAVLTIWSLFKLFSCFHGTVSSLISLSLSFEVVSQSKICGYDIPF